VDAMIAALAEFGERPDAICLYVRCHAIGWVD
jgi:hypothetical protein